MRVGFSGTRLGIVGRQHDAVFTQLTHLWVAGASFLAHGCCAGADRVAHAIWRHLGGDVYFCPGDEEQMAWAHRMARPGDIVSQRPQIYMERNIQIARSTDVLVAAPGTVEEAVRSGTWATVRRARARGSRVFLCLPTGEVRDEPARSGDQPSLL